MTPRRIHLIVGLVGVLTFLLTGQAMSHHHPAMTALPPDIRMMYVSRHLYLLGAALVNLALGLYLQLRSAGWRRFLQHLGSLLIVLSPILLLLAFLAEPERGLVGRGWRSQFGLFTLFGGVLFHWIATFFSPKNTELN
jgi:hypothetical protein